MVKGAAVYAPLERADMIYRVPKIHPAISIKLGPVVNGQVKGLIIGQKLQQKPDLFLPDANWPLVAPLKTPGQTIAQPAGRLAKNPDMPGHQSGFFGQLAIHGLNRRFVRVHAAWGNCQPPRPARRAQNTRPSLRASTIPTLGLNPSGSIMMLNAVAGYHTGQQILSTGHDVKQFMTQTPAKSRALVWAALIALPPVALLLAVSWGSSGW